MTSKLLEELKIEPKEEKKRIKEFVLGEVKRLGKKGAIIGLSGGLDSSTCAVLLKECLKENVFGLILPERDSNPRNIEDARKLAKELEIETKEIDLTPFFEKMGVYKLFDGRISKNKELSEKLIKGLERTFGQTSIFGFGFSSLFGRKTFKEKIISGYVKKAIALTVAKTRLRMVFLYYYGALKDYLVCGTSDKTEWKIGFYNGDAVVEIQPLLHLFKTQIRQLAKYLEVPKYIIEKPSSGDLFGRGLANEVVIGIPYETLDSILLGFEKGYSKEKIKELTGASEKQIEAVSGLVEIEKIRKSLPSLIENTQIL